MVGIHKDYGVDFYTLLDVLPDSLLTDLQNVHTVYHNIGDVNSNTKYPALK